MLSNLFPSNFSSFGGFNVDTIIAHVHPPGGVGEPVKVGQACDILFGQQKASATSSPATSVAVGGSDPG